MQAFDRFTKFDSSAPKLFLHDGDYSAWVTVVGGSWSWVVWYKESTMEGRKDWNMGAHEACEKAVEAMERLKASDRRPYFNVESV